jgi:hypothetical protein
MVSKGKNAKPQEASEEVEEPTVQLRTATRATKKTKAVDAQTDEKKQTGGNAKAAARDRFFKLYDAKTKTSYGRYTGYTPKQAASKGFTKMVQKYKNDGKQLPKISTIYLRESTRGSLRKLYGYEASRLKLDVPQELTIKDNTSGKNKIITYHFRNKIKKIHVPEEFQKGGAKNAKKTKKVKAKGVEKTVKRKAAAKTGSKTPKKQLKATTTR